MELKYIKVLNEDQEFVAKIELYEGEGPLKKLIGKLESEPIGLEHDLQAKDLEYCFYIENASAKDLASCSTLPELRALLIKQKIQWQIVMICVKYFYPKVSFEYMEGIEIPNNIAFVFDYVTFNNLIEAPNKDS